jgi:hypothetical protein
MTQKDWATRSEQMMMRRQFDRMIAFSTMDADSDEGQQQLSRQEQRDFIEGSRRPGWIRRHGWLAG